MDTKGLGHKVIISYQNVFNLQNVKISNLKKKISQLINENNSLKMCIKKKEFVIEDKEILINENEFCFEQSCIKLDETIKNLNNEKDEKDCLSIFVKQFQTQNIETEKKNNCLSELVNTLENKNIEKEEEKDCLRKLLTGIEEEKDFLIKELTSIEDEKILSILKQEKTNLKTREEKKEMKKELDEQTKKSDSFLFRSEELYSELLEKRAESEEFQKELSYFDKVNSDALKDFEEKFQKQEHKIFQLKNERQANIEEIKNLNEQKETFKKEKAKMKAKFARRVGSIEGNLYTNQARIDEFNSITERQVYETDEKMKKLVKDNKKKNEEIEKNASQLNQTSSNIASLKKVIDEQKQEIINKENEKNENDLKNKQTHFLKEAKDTLVAKKKEKKSTEIIFATTYYENKKQKTKTIPIGLQITSNLKHDAFLKLLFKATSAIITSLSCAKRKYKTVINKGKISFAALILLDCEFNRCILEKSFVPKYLPLIKKMLEINESFYQMKVTNSNMCLKQCFKIPNKCSNFIREDQKLRNNIEHFYNKNMIEPDMIEPDSNKAPVSHAEIHLMKEYLINYT